VGIGRAPAWSSLASARFPRQSREPGSSLPGEGHSLALEDLEDVQAELPDRLILGCGAHGRLRPDPAVLEALRQRGVEVEALPTAEAVRRYRDSDERRTAAALHLTC
jgi:hypothetical protein